MRKHEFADKAINKRRRKTRKLTCLMEYTIISLIPKEQKEPNISFLRGYLSYEL